MSGATAGAPSTALSLGRSLPFAALFVGCVAIPAFAGAMEAGAASGFACVAEGAGKSAGAASDGSATGAAAGGCAADAGEDPLHISFTTPFVYQLVLE